jgi:hypothetical protein
MASAQDSYKLSIPKGWGTEKILFPISFAPRIEYRGVEEIRFTPGWAKKDSVEYWSYAFLWFLDGNIVFEPVIIEEHLKMYYEGLISNNGTAIPKEKLISVEVSFQYDVKVNDDKEAFIGTIVMTDYMQQKPIKLNCKAHYKTCPQQKKTLIFYELSPQPLTHEVWTALDKLWIDLKL